MSDTETAPATETAGDGRFVTVTLSNPVRRGETVIDAITLRKPNAGELRGLTLQDVMSTDVTAILTLAQRISSPPLVKHEVDSLEPEDFAEIGAVIRGFFMTKAEREVIEAMIAEHQPKT